MRLLTGKRRFYKFAASRRTFGIKDPFGQELWSEVSSSLGPPDDEPVRFSDMAEDNCDDCVRKLNEELVAGELGEEYDEVLEAEGLLVPSRDGEDEEE